MKVLLALLTGLTLASLPVDALAFCLTTTCDPDVEPCPKDDNGCTIDGTALFWPDECVTFGVHADGSVLRNINFDLAEDVAKRAFQSWISADCGNGQTPSIGVSALGKIYCPDIEYNHNPPAPNANVIVFRDSSWPYQPRLVDGEPQETLALTTITFDPTTGALLDADIEVNSHDVALTTGDSNISADLQTILTHEVGHLFGLAHSLVSNASMNPVYDVTSKSFRQLADDDVKGICALYPPGEVEVASCKGQQPVHGFSRYCGEPGALATGGCSVASSGPKSPLDERGDAAKVGYGPWWGLAALAVFTGGWSRRKRRAPPR